MMMPMPRHLPALALCLLAAAGCIRQERISGNIFKESTVEQIAVGETTRDGVERLLGSPSSKSDFGAETWLYINATLQNHAFLEPKTENRTVVAVLFDDAGTVSEVKRYTEKDGRVVEIAREKTPTEGRSMNAIQQLLGNVGKFNQRAADSGGGD